MANSPSERLQYRGGKVAAIVPVIVFLFFCVLYFVIYKAFEMHALAMGALLGLLIGSLFVKKEHHDRYFDAAVEGAKDAVPIALLLVVIGMFAAMIKTAGLSNGFVYLARRLSVGGGAFTAFTFFAVCVIATATGSSIGTIFTCFPIFYPAGALLGCDPAALAGAIVCGGIFGDNLAPISDTTIISAGTQHYKSGACADIGGCVATRLKYAVIAGAVTMALYYYTGGASSAADVQIAGQDFGPAPLVMLIPVAIMLAVAVKSRSIYKAITAGLIIGTLIGLAAGIISPASVISVKNGSPAGYLTDGVGSMATTAILVLSVYAIMGVLTAAGTLQEIADAILLSKLGRTPRGAELAMMLGIMVTTLIFGGVTSASMATFGKIQDEIGFRTGLHPYRRANLLDGFANSLPLAVSFLSVFAFIGATLAASFENITPVSLTQIGFHMYYCYALFIVLLLSVLTGFGRIYEGEDGRPSSRPAADN